MRTQTNLLKVKASVIRTFVMERKCPDYGGFTVYVTFTTVGKFKKTCTCWIYVGFVYITSHIILLLIEVVLISSEVIIKCA